MAEKESPHFKWLTPILADEADIPTHLERLAKEIDEDLHNLKVAELGPGLKGQLIIVNAGGVAAWQTANGDIENNNAGVFTILAQRVTAAKMALATITAAQMAPESIGFAQLVALSVGTAKIAFEAINESKIANSAVTTVKLAELAVTQAKIAALAVGTAQLANEAVTNAKIANGAVNEPKIEDGAVSSRKMKPSMGVVNAGIDLFLGEAYADVNGTTMEIIPGIPSTIAITAIFNFKLEEGPTEGVGTMSLDGVDQVSVAEAKSPAVSDLEVTCAQVYLLHLTGAKQTIKMRGKRGAAGAGFIRAVHTRYLWKLFAA
jgi:hypothetical protein